MLTPYGVCFVVEICSLRISNIIFYNVDLLIPEGCEHAVLTLRMHCAPPPRQRVPLFMALWYFMANGSLANVFSVQRSWPHPVRHRSETLNQQWDRCDLCKTGTMQMVYVALVMVRYFTGVVSGLAVSKCVQTWHRSHDVTREGNKSMTIIPWRSCCFNEHSGKYKLNYCLWVIDFLFLRLSLTMWSISKWCYITPLKRFFLKICYFQKRKVRCWVIRSNATVDRINKTYTHH